MLNTTLKTKKKTGLFYGYWVLAVGFVCLMFQAGCNVYSFGLFVKPLEAEFGWERAAIMWANTISTLATAFSGLFVGRIINRYNPKLIIVTGAIVATSSYISLYFARELWQLYLFYGLSGAGFAAVGFMPISSIILTGSGSGGVRRSGFPEWESGLVVSSYPFFSETTCSRFSAGGFPGWFWDWLFPRL